MDKNKVILGGAVVVIVAYLIYKNSQNKAKINAEASALAEQRAKEQAAKSEQDKKQLAERSKYVLDYYDNVYKQMALTYPTHHDTLEVKKVRDLIQKGLLNNEEVDALTDMILWENNEYLGKKTQNEIRNIVDEKVWKVWFRNDNSDKSIIKDSGN
jgi:translation elongation factor EF-4